MRLLLRPQVLVKAVHGRLKSTSTSSSLSSLRVCVLGVPNAGKSSLINALTNNKTHTTRLCQLSIGSWSGTQLIFSDTPGLVKGEEARRFHLEDTMLSGPAEACEEAQLLLVCQDVSNRYVREAIDKRLLRLLAYHVDKPSILVLTKIDQMPNNRDILGLVHKLTLGCVRGRLTTRFEKTRNNKNTFQNVQDYLDDLEKRYEDKEQKMNKKRRLKELDPLAFLESFKKRSMSELELEQSFQGIVGWPGFDDVLTVSATQRIGVEELRQTLIDKSLPVDQWEFAAKTKITHSPKMLVLRTIQAKMLDVLPHILPYKLNISIHDWKVDAGNEENHRGLPVPSTDEAPLRLVISLKSDMTMATSALLRDHADNLKTVKQLVEQDLQDFFCCPVFVRFLIDDKIESRGKKIIRRYKNYAEERALLLGKIEK